MTENNYRNPDNFQYEEEESIDIMEYILKLWKKRKMIIIWCVVGAIIGLIAGFSIPKTYSASVTLAPEVEGKSNSNLSSLASMAEKIRITESSAIIKPITLLGDAPTAICIA